MNQVSEWFRMTQPRRQHPQNVLKNKFPQGRHSKNWNKFRVELNQSRFSRCISQFLSYRVLLCRESRLPSTAMTQLLTCTDEFFVKLILRLAVVSLCFETSRFSSQHRAIHFDSIEMLTLDNFSTSTIKVFSFCLLAELVEATETSVNVPIVGFFRNNRGCLIVLDFVDGSDGIEEWTFMHSALILKQRFSNSEKDLQE